MCLALAGGFFITSNTWETPSSRIDPAKPGSPFPGHCLASFSVESLPKQGGAGTQRLAGLRKMGSRGGEGERREGPEGMKDPKESFQGRVNFVYFPKIKAETSWGGHTPLDGLRDAPPELCPGAAS